MGRFDCAFGYMLENEGGVVEDKNDKGGLTNYGISFNFLKSFGLKYDFNKNGIIQDDIKNLSLDNAKLIYLNEFWNQAPFDEIQNQLLCNYIFDMAINMGLSSAIKCLQKSLWSAGFPRKSIEADGILGPNTLRAVNSMTVCLLMILRAVRCEYYLNLVRTNPMNKVFLEGWLNRTFK